MNPNLFKVLFLIITIITLSACSPEDGSDGQDGVDGVDGINGTNGQNGENGTDGEDGIDGVDGIDGEDGSNGGVTFLVLSGDITDQEAISKIDRSVGINTQFILIQNTTTLTTVDLSEISEAVEIEIRNNDQLRSVSFPNLETIVTSMQVTSNEALATIEAPMLMFANAISILDNRDLNDIDLPLLEENLDLTIERNNNLANIDFPLLADATNIFIDSNDNLTSLGLISLESGLIDFETSIFISNNPRLEFIDISRLEAFGRIDIFRNDALTAINFDSLTDVLDFSISGSAMVSIALPSISNAEGLGFSFNNSLTELSFPELERVNSLSISDNDNLGSFEIPQLSSIGNFTPQTNETIITTPSGNGGGLSINNNSNLERYSLPLLTTFSGNLNISNNPRLEAIVVDTQINNTLNLERIDIRNNNAIRSLNFINFINISAVTIRENAALTTVAFPLLETVASRNPVELFVIENNASLTSLNFPSLISTSGDISIIRNRTLSDIDFSELQNFLFQFTISGNNLPSMVIDNLLAHFVSITPPLTNKVIIIEEEESPTEEGLEDIQTLSSNGNFVEFFR